MVAKNARTSVHQLPSAGPDRQRPEEEKDDLSIEYPDSDGEPMAENDFQYTAMAETTSTLRVWFSGRPDVYVASDMLMYYRMNDNQTRVAPDIYVVFGAAGNHKRRNWIIWREGKAPDFVMEIASPSTWERDAEEKREIYANMGVTEYWRFDPTGEHFTPALVGETLVEGQYRGLPLETDGEGRLWSRSTVLGLDIYVLTPDELVEGLELRLYDPAGQQWLLTPGETEAARQDAVAAQEAAEGARQGELAARLEAEEALQSSEEARQQLEDENERLRELLRSLQSGQ